MGDQPGGPPPEQAQKLLTQHRGAGNVKLADQRRDGLAILGAGREHKPARW
jgi:hypothetical protein